ncbi:GTP-binding protein Era [Promicromonospora umidemergens]|uniref:GTPase Era n=1 Tax=Promicromonospora umidemergens TaxID=629679 RepID=A0ABP8X8Z5_9MICO|nr:GTPase Era [Promicromonospora umidemergens]MCP2281340.1 GTP-binding protein Era [Promicromonospora umidemergens]
MSDQPAVHQTAEHRSGFACLVGRPNAGKSTLTNALVGQKVAIMSARPQTTRHTIRGIVHREDAQLVLVDTPGLHRPRTLLGERLNDLVRDTLSEVDVIAFCLPADQKVGPGDRYIAAQLAELMTGRRGRPVVAVVTKADLVPRETLMQHLISVDQLAKTVDREWADIVPVSAKDGYQVEELEAVLISHLPEGPDLYPDGELTDEPEAVMVAELVREAALEGVRDELPHSLAVVVDEIVEREGTGDPEKGKPALLDVRVNLFVERDSQKAIIIGRGGSRLRSVGTEARQGIEKLLGQRIYLDLHVKVAKDWQRDPKQLRRLGF